MELGLHENLDQTKPCKPLSGTPIKKQNTWNRSLSILANLFKMVKAFNVFFLKDWKTIEVTKWQKAGDRITWVDHIQV